MNKKTWTIIMAVVLIASFFLPLNLHGSRSAFDLVKSPGSPTGFVNILEKYIWILIPLSALMLLIGALNRGNYPGGRGLWVVLPLLAVLYVILKPVLVDHVGFGTIIKACGVGMWVMIAGSLLLAFYNPRP
jgi:hypothetical protein